MLLEILVEEPSAEAALRELVPRIVGSAVEVRYHTFRGKAALLRRLPHRLAGYLHYPVDADVRVLVLVDRDDQDCLELKETLEGAAADAGLRTRASAGRARFRVCNRIAVEELESWFIGDPDALVAAYPRVPASFTNRARFRQPDSVSGGTWEALERLLQRHRYHLGGLAKIRLASDVARHMDPARNRSPSFIEFRDGLLRLVAQ
jgi:hypothetical protein